MLARYGKEAVHLLRSLSCNTFLETVSFQQNDAASVEAFRERQHNTIRKKYLVLYGYVAISCDVIFHVRISGILNADGTPG